MKKSSEIEIVDAIAGLATAMDREFDKVHHEIGEVKDQLNRVEAIAVREYGTRPERIEDKLGFGH